jgi:hypothetical protein
MDNKRMAISQSLMKDLQEYLNGQECGLLLKAKYVDNVETQSSDAMLLGQYFEYIATGQVPRNGQIPEPKLVYQGKPNEKLSEPYQRAYASAMYAKSLFQALNIEILSTGEKIQYDKASGTTDIRATWNGKKCIIDLKYSGLLDNKWDERGWHFDTLEQKDKLMIQAVHYTYIESNRLGEDIDFYFFLFSSTNPSDVRIAKVEVEPLKLELHKENVERAFHIWNNLIENDSFKAHGSLLKCSSCPINETCPSRVILPQITTIYY